MLLINQNPVISKLAGLSAQKAGIELVIELSVDHVEEGLYELLFIDEGQVDGEWSGTLKEGVEIQKSCLIYADDEHKLPGFDFYLKKPFLPTEMVETLTQMRQSLESAEEEGDEASSETPILASESMVEEESGLDENQSLEGLEALMEEDDDDDLFDAGQVMMTDDEDGTKEDLEALLKSLDEEKQLDDEALDEMDSASMDEEVEALMASEELMDTEMFDALDDEVDEVEKEVTLDEMAQKEEPQSHDVIEQEASQMVEETTIEREDDSELESDLDSDHDEARNGVTEPVEEDMEDKLVEMESLQEMDDTKRESELFEAVDSELTKDKEEVEEVVSDDTSKSESDHEVSEMKEDQTIDFEALMREVDLEEQLVGRTKGEEIEDEFGLSSIESLLDAPLQEDEALNMPLDDEKEPISLPEPKESKGGILDEVLVDKVKELLDDESDEVLERQADLQEEHVEIVPKSEQPLSTDRKDNATISLHDEKDASASSLSDADDLDLMDANALKKIVDEVLLHDEAPIDPVTALKDERLEHRVTYEQDRDRELLSTLLGTEPTALRKLLAGAQITINITFPKED